MWPLAARAQQPAMPVVGFLSGTFETSFTAAIRRGFGEQGYVEGRNVEIVYRWARLQYDLLPALAADLVRRKVDVIVATGGANSVQAAKSATSTIPIVFAAGQQGRALARMAGQDYPAPRLQLPFLRPHRRHGRWRRRAAPRNHVRDDRADGSDLRIQGRK
jgi:putative ABC transport system substrate-binding protein